MPLRPASMAGKHSLISPNPNRSFSLPSSFLIFTLSLLALVFVFFLISSSPYSSDFIPLSRNPNPKPNAPLLEHSFLASLEKFLTPGSSAPSPSSDTAAGGGDESVERALDDAIWRRETGTMLGDPLETWSGLSVARVYVYEMPAKFTYDLLWLFWNSYRDTGNLTSNGSPVHRLIEQHSIDYWLWADLISPQSTRLLKNVIRVHRQEEADFFYIPFFSTISYFLLERQQCKALYRVWKHPQGSFEMGY